MTYVQQFTIEQEGNLSLSCIELVCIWLHTVTCFNEQGLATKQKYVNNANMLKTLEIQFSEFN